jgi:hypothetical protein
VIKLNGLIDMCVEVKCRSCGREVVVREEVRREIILYKILSFYRENKKKNFDSFKIFFAIFLNHQN